MTEERAGPDGGRPEMQEAKRFPMAGIATPHYLASSAGLAVLADGGNAIDAVVAANLALGVVAPYYCGYGGDLFAIVWDGQLNGYVGAGRAPAAATPEAVIAATTGAGLPAAYGPLEGGRRAPGIGPHSVTVPQAVEGWFALLERWGTRSFGELSRAALRYARDGFELSHSAMEVLGGCQAIYAHESAWSAVYGGVTAGDVLRQPALAGLIERLGADGPDAYYTGPVAEAVCAAVAAGGGLLERADLASHAGEWVAPLRARYRDVEIAELPPPTQGVTALQLLSILDGFDLTVTDPVEREHVMIEAAKLALADRDAFVTDPHHMARSVDELLGDARVAELRARIDPKRAQFPGVGSRQLGGTAYLCAADGDGLLVSLIQSNFFAFGSGIHVPEWGINLHNRGASFSLEAESVNVIAPRKRPMHTLIPAMGLRDGRPWLVFGSMGGDAQAQIHPQLLAHRVDDGSEIQAAITAPRWAVEPGTWEVRAERRFPDDLLDGLRDRGQRMHRARAYDSAMGHAHAIELTRRGYAVAFDPRSEGAALGL